MTAVLWMALAVLFAGAVVSVLHPLRVGGRRLSAGQRKTYHVLRYANQTSPLLRRGLTADGLEEAIGPLRELMATAGVVVADTTGILASAGVDQVHRSSLVGTIDAVLASGRPVLVPAGDLRCGAGHACRLRAAVAAPLHVEGAVVGVLVAVDSRASAGLLNLCVEVARFISHELGPADPRPEGRGGGAIEMIPVGSPGRTMLIARSEVAWVESAGDYVRLHTFDDRSFLVRLSMSRLEEAWTPEGFARIHRRYLVCLRAVHELRSEGAQMWVELPGTELPVSRRHIRQVRDRLVRQTVSSR